MILALPLIVSSCATTGRTATKPQAYCPPQTVYDACAGWKPIILHGNDWDVLSPLTVKEILAHDEYGVRLGCWKKPK